MPGYGGSGQAALLRENQQTFLFQNETVGVGGNSIAVQLERVPRQSYPWGVSFQVAFTDGSGNPADPGAYEIDIQTSDIDQDTQYCTIAKLSTAGALNASFVGRVELTAFYAKYARVHMTALANAVRTTVMVTR